MVTTITLVTLVTTITLVLHWCYAPNRSSDNEVVDTGDRSFENERTLTRNIERVVKERR